MLSVGDKEYKRLPMSNDDNGELNLIRIAQKETFSAEEKQFILDRLNKERLESQAEEAKANEFSKENKTKILTNLNEKRLSVQKREEIKKKRTYKKKIYKFGSKMYYKFMHMEREYYIEIEDCDKITSRPAIITLYYRTFYELQKKDVLLKTEIYSDKFFISYNAIRVYFKSYSLEDDR